MLVNTIQDNFLKLTPKMQLELFRFFDLLVNQKENNNNSNELLKFDWQDGLSNLNDKFDSVSLQHKALEWR